MKDFYWKVWLLWISLLGLSGYRMIPMNSIHQRKESSFPSILLMRLHNSPQLAIDQQHEELINEAMRNLFYHQVQEEYGLDPKPLNYQDFKKRNKFIPYKSYVEPTIGLLPNVPLAYVSKNKMYFGNYHSPKENSTAIVIQSSAGILQTIDISQIIEVWDDLEDEHPPTTPTDWANIVTDAIQVFRSMSPRKSNLEEFYTILKDICYTLPVDSLDLSVYIFQERKFFNWMQPYIAAKESEEAAERWEGNDDDEEEEDQNNVKVRKYSAAERYAALVLLFNDRFHFKRRSSSVSYPEEMIDDTNAYEVDEETGQVKYNRRKLKLEVEEDLRSIVSKATTYLKVGGFTLLDESICTFQETELFSRYYDEKVKKSTDGVERESTIPNDSFTSSIINRILRSLEIYALTKDTKSPPRVIKSILRKYGVPLSSKGAQELIMKLGYEGSQNQQIPYNLRIVQRNSGKPGQATDNGGSNNAYIQNLTPWSKDILEEVKKLAIDKELRKQKILATTVGKFGKATIFGKMDYRKHSSEHPPICIDASYASFFDDAFSLSPSTGEILIHIADVRELVSKYDELNIIAKQRLSTTFLPSGPLHMFPPQALETLKLSKDGPNEVITVAIRVDPNTGEILRYRIFPAIIGPVYPIETAQANDIIDRIGIEETTNTEGNLVYKSKRFNKHPDAVINDLIFLNTIVEKMCQRDEWIDVLARKKSNYQVRLNKKTNTVKYIESEHTGANRIVNTLLTLYSNSSYDYCEKANIPVPITWENRDVVYSNIPRRFATQPLRKWISLLQQQQLRSALKLEFALPKDKCALAVSYHNSQRRQSSKIIHQNKAVDDFEALERHVYQIQQLQQHQPQTSQQPPFGEDDREDAMILEAEGLGRGGLVRIYPYNINALADHTVQKGELVKVKIEKLNKETKTVLVNVLR